MPGRDRDKNTSLPRELVTQGRTCDSQVCVSGLTPPSHIRSEVTVVPAARLEGPPTSKTSSEDGTLVSGSSHLREVSAGVRAILSCLISSGIGVCQVITGCETR